MARRFTLVELMLVVALVAVLTALAVPLFAEMQSKARYAEYAPNEAAILNASVLFNHDNPSTVLIGEYNPRARLSTDKQAVAWNPAASGWSTLGWVPDGAVRCAYRIQVAALTVPVTYTSEGACNVDGNDTLFVGWLIKTADAAAVHTSQCWSIGGAAAVSPPCY